MKINTYKPAKPFEYRKRPGEKELSIKDSFSPSQPEKEWTFLVYLDATKKHDKLALYKLKELEKAGGSSKNVNVVAEVTRNHHFLDRFTNDWTGTKRYYVTEGGHKRTSQLAHLYLPGHTKDIKSSVVKDLPEQTEATGESFEQFLEWGMKNYPAKHYGVIISSVDGGIEGAIGEEGKIQVNLPDLAKAMEKAEQKTGKKVELTVMDQSNSATMEAAVELAGKTDFFVGSEGYLQGLKMPLGKSIKTIKKGVEEKGNITSLEAGKAFVYETGRQRISSVSIPTASVMDLNKTEKATDLLKDFSIALKDYPNKETLRLLTKKSQQFSRCSRGKKELVDLRDFARKVSEETKTSAPHISKIGEKLDRILDEMVVSNFYHGQKVDKAKGVAIYSPLKKDHYTRDISKKIYPELKISKETKWQDYIEELGTNKKFHNLLTSLGVSPENMDFMTKHWDKICEYSLKGLKVGSVGLALGALKSVISGTLGASGKMMGLALGGVQVTYGAKEAYDLLTNEELEYKIQAADPIYKAAQGVAVASALTLPIDKISTLGAAIVTPIAAMGGAYQAFKGAYDVFAAVKDKNLINKKEKIIDETMESAKGIAVLATTLGIVMGLGAGFTTAAGIIAIGIPTAREIYRGIMGLKYLKEEEDPLTFNEKMNKIPEQSSETARYFISRTVEKAARGIAQVNI